MTVLEFIRRGINGEIAIEDLTDRQFCNFLWVVSVVMLGTILLGWLALGLLIYLLR
ncbi:MAG: hypothetical protein AAF092_17200 [Pseudomonadota bacterium]